MSKYITADFATLTAAIGVARANISSILGVTFTQTPQTPYLWIGGNFTTYKAANINSIVATTTDGTINSNFNIGFGFNSQVFTSAVQSDGKVILGGAFTAYSGSSYSRIIRLNSNGTIDNTFNPGTGFNSDVYSLLIQSDNKILAGGNFGTYSGSSVNRLVRLNTNGTIDATYNVGTGASGIVYSLATQSDNKILVVGAMATYSGSTVNFLFRTNDSGVRDTTYNTGGGLSTTAVKVLVQSDGKIVAAGNFTTYSGSGTNATRIVRTNISGTRDTTFNPGAGFNSSVTAAELQPDGKIVAAGNFTTYSGSSYTRIVRLNTSGTIDNTLNPGTGFDAFNGTQNDIKISGSYIYTAGNFTTYSGSNIRGIARLNSNGTIDNIFNYGTASANLTGRGVGITNTNSGVRTLSFSGSNGLIIGGSFTTYQEPIYVRSLILSSSGTVSSSYNGQAMGFGNGLVYCAITQSDGKILVGGSFTTYGTTSVTRIVRINKDGTYDSSFNSGAGFNNNVYDLKQQPDGKIIVAGLFTTYSGSTVNRITRLNTNGTIDPTFNTGLSFDNSVYSIDLQSDGKILATGNFPSYSGSGTNATRIVRINTSGSRDDSFATGTGLSGTGRKIKQQSDGKILVAGSATAFNGSFTYRYIYRLTNSGALDTSFNSGTTPNFPNGVIGNFNIDSNGNVILIGAFTSYSGSAYNRIVKTNNSGAIDTSFNPGTGFNIDPSFAGVPDTSIYIDPAGPIYIAGNFNSYSGSTLANRIVKINSNGTIASDWDYGTTPLFNASGSGFNAYSTTIIPV